MGITTTEPRPLTSSTTLRLLPVPSADPPYDDEAGQSAPVVDGTLALAFPSPPVLLPLRLVPPADPADDETSDGTPPPDPRPWSRRLVQAVVEVLAGVRSAAQLSRFATFEVLEQLERATGRLGGRPGGAPAQRPAVIGVRVCQLDARIAETSAVVDTGTRCRAIALRLEADGGRWRCTALELG